MFQALLDRNVDVDSKDKSGSLAFGALVKASQNGRTEIVLALLGKNADLKQRE